MKNIVFVACALSSFNAIAADAPQVSLEGRLEFQAGIAKEKYPHRYMIPGSVSSEKLVPNTAFVNDTVLDFKADGKMDNGILYGALIRIHADTSTATNSETTVGDKTMVYLQSSKLGRLEAGNTPGAGGLLEMDTVNYGRGTWGIDGYWSRWVVDRTVRTSAILQTFSGFGVTQKDSRSFEFLVSPNLLSNYSGHYYSDAPKINFFTKPINEITLGLSFIPDLDSNGTIAGRAATNAGPQDERKGNPASYKDIISGGFIYEGKLSKNWGVKTGLAGEVGRAKVSYTTNLRAYEGGLSFIYNDAIKFGGTYGNWFDSLMLRQKTTGMRHKSDYWTLGYSHQIEKFGYSFGYMESRRAGGVELLGKQLKDAGLPVTIAQFSDARMNKFRNMTFDVDYKLADGFLPYVGGSRFSFKESQGAKDTGYVLIAGTRLTF